MTDAASAKPSSHRAGNTLSLALSLGAVVLLFVVSGIVSYLNTRNVYDGAQQVAHTHEVMAVLDDVLSLMKDAETGQRGFVITGDARYLEPHAIAVARIDERLRDAERIIAGDPDQLARLPALREQVGIKLRELAEVIAVRRTRGFDAAQAVVGSDRGKEAMDAIRAQLRMMEEAEQETRKQRIIEMASAYRLAVASGIITCIMGAVLSAAVATLVLRSVRARQLQDWLQSGQVGLSQVMTGQQRLDQLGERILHFLAQYCDAHAGAFYARNGSSYRRVATYGVPAENGAPEQFTSGDGLLGQAAKDCRAIVVRDVPEGYLTVSSALGRGQPRQLVVAPFAVDEMVNAVIELGFLHPLEDAMLELLQRAAESIATAVRSADYRANLQNLLEETQRQAEELQTQAEELRVSNEELEEQSRALKESQARLENQQAEMEQTNAQLEQQTQILEAQRDSLAQAKASLQGQTRQLEQASQYKSDFLANMSHELRTPLNSSLILAKLLADNREGNLSAEQVKYAETISAAGNDLLTLINDILDLSKIEAGHMDLRPEPMRLTQLVDDLRRLFQPVAEQKELEFQANIAPGCPGQIDTDRQRLEQVLKNLLSNAFKFTEAGSVTLNVTVAGERVRFAVQDTGIGIPEHQQQVVFEAFRQADGTTNRKYGGTGLGLSIARELTRLLGGELRLDSEPGRGSTFTVELPMAFDATASQARSAERTARAAPPLHVEKPLPAPTRPAPRTRRVADDREQLTGDRRVILVVDDDVSFTRIIYDLAHEMGFQCLIATTAEEGLAVAAQHRPSAVVLDIGLPDNSGMSVLDRLKHDARTRHIPVHVVSAHDFAQTALSLGAVGYMMKPVKREELVHAFQRLESRLDQRLRRVLIVEDDPVQLDSLRQLLIAHDVETVGAGSAAECLDRLKDATFDCMVLDLTLPDASGYSLLETLSREDSYAFPPVIVYTGRELSADEEQRLRRYSKSIIIKGAKSHERLLDEVTLFLHQMISELPAEQQQMLEKARSRDAALEGRRILVVEDDVRNVFALTSILEPRGAVVQIARNGREALEALARTQQPGGQAIDLVLMDVMMPEMDGITAMREIRKQAVWRKLPIIALTAKAMKDDQEQCLSAGANDYLAKPLDVEKLLSLVRVWMPR